MKKTLTALAILALLPAGAALADDDDCTAPRDTWQPREAALQVAQKNGWTVQDFEIDDGCYEIDGRDGDGREIEVKLDPATLQIVDIDYEDDDARGGAPNPAPAGAAQPPQNGLFGNGAPPTVQVN
ncbi:MULTISPECIES: PepSY domain-containing protein [Rhodobacterales]|uniref:PepSY domain-containing protein n=2 Tax=Rhodobacterales TaxID=204455 RepID=A0A8J7LRF2_9RHOB|nr:MULTISPECIES: PepSY domain-containing protein [Rhodobacterales]MBJ6370794.1 PepSY domain-containing protein [Arenibacterium arenosum]MCE8512321.1 PepSY domain-containing protein [Ruegeria pomeroyi]MCE8537962.1 PepSY domain-containing protein [Ruegeria pomeroyi]MCE8556286.1 PepSY domain-containing protein [Ruegeria pomeroyi]